MQYCSKCGTELSEGAKFCQNCGEDLEKSDYVFKQVISSRDKMKKRRASTKKAQPVIVVLLVFLFIGVFVAIITGSTDSKDDDVNGNERGQTAIVVDVEKFANISSAELIELLGDPDEISEGVCTGEFEIPCTYYEYDNNFELGEVSFAFVNDYVVRLTSYSEYSYDGKASILNKFGINKSDSCVVVADTGGALRYRCASDKVDDFWINLIEDDSFEFLQITYDMEYYSEWYMPLSSTEEIEYKTDAQMAIKSILKSPSTADFPWYDWSYAKNLFYIYVSSYVDSQNAFGAEIRSNFTFVYSRATKEIVLAIVDDEVIVNNGYIKTEELIKQMYESEKYGISE